MKRNNAFTLTETLIMVAVIGVIAVISAVSFRNIQPDKDAVMLRKAYSDMSKAVATLINDQDLYPLSMASTDYTFQLQYLIQESAASLNQDVALDERVDLNPSSCLSVPTTPSSSGSSSYSVPSTSGSSSLNVPMKRQICFALALETVEESARCEAGTVGAYYCNADCSYTCAPGYSGSRDSNGDLICSNSTPSTSTSSSSSSSSSTSSGTSSHILDIGDVHEFELVEDYKENGDDIIKDSGNKGSTDLSEGSYNDTQTTSSSNGTTSASLSPHGTVFLNTTVKPGVTAYTSNNKFAYNFGTLFKTKDLSCNNNICTFTTDNGMKWTITDNFANANQNAIISVDVNGSEVGSNVSTGTKPDVYNFRVDASGAISVYSTGASDTASQKALRTLKKRS